MQNVNKYVAIAMALILGTIATIITSGCQPANNPGKRVSPGPVTQGSKPAPSKPTPSPVEEPKKEEPKVEEPKKEEAKPDQTKKDEAKVEVAKLDSSPATAKPFPAIDKTANAPIKPGDWAQWGGTSYRNNTPIVKNAPTEWDPAEFDRKTGEWKKDKAKNIKWVSTLGSQTYGNPVIAGGKVYVGTNNTGGYVKRYPSDVDLGVLLCFNEADGKFLWQHSSEKLPTGRVHDWPLQGICCSPYVEGKRVWFVTSRGEVRCLDTEGFYDNEDDGPLKNDLGRLFDVMRNEDPKLDQVTGIIDDLKANKIGDMLRSKFAAAGSELPADVAIKVDDEGKKWTVTAKVGDAAREFKLTLQGPRFSAAKVISVADKDEADVMWVYDMMKELGVSQHNMCSCSITALGDILFVCTSNGLDESHANVPPPTRPASLRWIKTRVRCFGPTSRRVRTFTTGNGRLPPSPCSVAYHKFSSAVGMDGCIRSARMRERTASPNCCGKPI